MDTTASNRSSVSSPPPPSASFSPPPSSSSSVTSSSSTSSSARLLFRVSLAAAAAAAAGLVHRSKLFMSHVSMSMVASSAKLLNSKNASRIPCWQAGFENSTRESIPASALTSDRTRLDIGSSQKMMWFCLQRTCTAYAWQNSCTGMMSRMHLNGDCCGGFWIEAKWKLSDRVHANAHTTYPKL